MNWYTTLKQLRYKRIQLIVKHQTLLNQINQVNADEVKLDLLIEQARKNKAIELVNEIINL